MEYALDSCPKLKWQDVLTLLKSYNKKLLYQKVGYLFEKHFGDDAPQEFYDECLKNSGNTTVYFECKVGYAKLVAKWKLMVPEERSEPDELF